MKKQTLFKRSNGIYYVKFIDQDGVEKRVSTKCTKKNEALKFLSNFEGSASKVKEEKAPNYAFNFLKERFLEYNKRMYSKKYYEILKLTFSQLPIEMGNNFIAAVTKVDIESFIFERIRKSPYGAFLDFRNLKTFFNWCVTNSYLEINPMRSIKFPKLPEKENLYISPEQLELIVNNEPSGQLKDIYLFAYNTGMRLGEITNCRISWLDLSERVITVKNDEFLRPSPVKFGQYP